MKNKIKNIILFIIFAVVLGAIAGAVVWAILKVMFLGIDFFWTWLPEQTGHEKIYTVVVCILGGLVVGLYQKITGVMVESLETVMKKLKQDGTYDYSKLHLIIIGAILPLIFGGCLGPEAGLTGVIVGLCCWAGDRMKYKTEEIRQLAESGMAATLGLIFNAPLFGFVNNYEKESSGKDETESAERERKARENAPPIFSEKTRKKLKPIIYISSIAGGFGAMALLTHFVGGGSGLPRFETLGNHIDANDWKWMAIFVIAGIGAGILYKILDNITKILAALIENKRVISCLIGGICLAAFGVILPMTMFSGETQMEELMSNWQQLSVMTLFCTAIGKIILVNLCINFGWKGGNIFPLIYAGVSLGYCLVSLTGVAPILGIALCTAALCGYVMRKPVTVVAVLLLCFPVIAVIPMIVSAYLASLVPVLGHKKTVES